jgi:hypothetical protein
MSAPGAGASVEPGRVAEGPGVVGKGTGGALWIEGAAGAGARRACSSRGARIAIAIPARMQMKERPSIAQNAGVRIRRRP